MNPTQKKYLKERKKSLLEEKSFLEEELVSIDIQKQSKKNRIIEIETELIEIDSGIV